MDFIWICVTGFPSAQTVDEMELRHPRTNGAVFRRLVGVDESGRRGACPQESLRRRAPGVPFTGPGYVGGDSATPGVKTVEVRDTVNVSAVAQRFLRVKVTH